MDSSQKQSRERYMKELIALETDLLNAIREARIKDMPMRDLIQSGAQGELLTIKPEDEDE